MLDSHFAEARGTNIQKQFYKKKDLLDLEDEEVPVEKPSKDDLGEEVVEHKNTLNNVL